jgi:tetratricopeptide (TPR) repeat protein
MVESGQSVAVLDRLEADADNLRAALAWLIERDRADAAARMIRHLSGLFNVRHPREGLGWCQQVVAIDGQMPATVKARLLTDTAWAAWYAGDFEASARYGDDAVEAGGNDVPARAYWILGNLAFVAGDHEQALEHFQRAILDDGSQQGPRSEVMANGMLALVRAELGEEAEARRLVADAIDLAERLGEPTILAATYDTVAAALARIGSTPEAITVWEQGLVHLDAAGPILACVYRSSYALRLNDPREAARVLGVAIPIAKDQLSGLHQAQPLLPAATIAAAIGRERIAAQLLGAFNHYGAGMATLTVGQASEHLASRLQERLGVATVDDESARGAGLTIADALQLAEETVNAAT